MRAAVLHAVGEPLVVEDVELEAPRRDEVRVRITASGICHSDLSLAAGKWPTPLPIVLGHEGAGVIDAVGEGVDESRVGGHHFGRRHHALRRGGHAAHDRQPVALDHS